MTAALAAERLALPAFTAPTPPTDGRQVSWRYTFTDMLTGRPISTLPLVDAAFTQVLSGAGSATGRVPLASRAVQARDPFASTVPRRTVCWAQRLVLDPVTGEVAESPVLWGGPVVGRKRSRSGRYMELAMVSWAGYFARRLIRTDRAFVQADDLDVFRWLFTQALAIGPVAGVGVTTGALSGQYSDRTYQASALKPVLEAAEQLAASGIGFDWRELYAQDATTGAFSAVFDAGSPRVGRVAPADLVWSSQRNTSRAGQLLDYTVVEDGSAVANWVTALGAGTGPTQLRSVVTGADVGRDESAFGYPLWESSLGLATDELKTQDALDRHARGKLLTLLSSETRVDEVTVRGDLPPVLTSYQIGDSVTLRLGSVLAPGQDQVVIGQIVGRAIQPPQQGRNETVKLTIQGTPVAA